MELQQAIDIISAGRCYRIEFVKNDSNRSTGGQLRTIENPRIQGAAHDTKEHRTIVVRNGKIHTTIHTGLILKMNGEIVL